MTEKTKKRKLSLGCSPLFIVVSIIAFVLIGIAGIGSNNSPDSTNDERSFFSEKTDFLSDNPNQNNNSFLVFNYDSDDDLEIFVTNYNSSNFILDWNGSVLERIVDPKFNPEPNYAIDAAACDVDNDGREEVYISTGDLNGQNAYKDYLLNYNNSNWEIIDNSTLTNGRDVVCIDSNGDQVYEFLHIDLDKKIRHLAFDKAKNNLVNIESTSGLKDITVNGSNLLVLPYFGKYSDILILNNIVGSLFLKNSGDGRFSEFSIGSDIKNIGNNANTSAYLDMNKDGLLDVIVGNKDANHLLLIQQEDGKLVNEADESFRRSSNVSSFLIADFDFNGFDDIFMTNLSSENRFFAGFPIGYDILPISSAIEQEDATSTGLAGNLDLDNAMELMLGHSDNKPLKLFDSFETENNFITIEVLTKSGGYARGATVKLSSNSTEQVKVVDLGSGYSSSSPSLIFGLAGDEIAKTIEVTFPDGTTKKVENSRAGENVKIIWD